MKIIHVLAPAQAGGLERVVHALAIGQQRSGHEVMVVPVVDAWTGDHPFAGPLGRARVAIRPVVVPPRAYLRERAELARIFADSAPDVVHSHGYHTDVIAGPVARRAGIATVATAHGFTRGPWRNRLYEGLGRRAMRRYDAVVAVSRPLADELRRAGVSADRLHVVPNAWSWISEPLGRADARRELGLDPERFTVGWVGRMTREKGLDVLVDALRELTDVPVTVCAIGDGPERGLQEQRAAAAGVGDRIRWAGLVREAGRLIQAFDALVICSRTEGLPMVLLETIASGVPLIATAVGGIPDVVSPDEALLVPSESPAALAAAIRSVREDPGGAAGRARAALARLEGDYSEAPWLERHERVYESARARAGGHAAP